MDQRKNILISEMDARCGREMKEALQSRGYSARVKTSAVMALEYAVRRRPHLAIVAADLPVIDGRTLVDILHANPNTRDILTVFLAADPDRFETASGFREEVVGRPCAPREVVALVEKLFGRTDRVARLTKQPELLSRGDLSEVRLAEVLQGLNANRKTGTLLIDKPGEARGAGQGFVYLKDGEVINALLGPIDGEKSLHRLLQWEGGQYELLPDQAVTEWRIRRPLHELLAENARQADLMRRLAGQLPGPVALLRLRAKVASLPPGVHPLTQEVLLLLEYYSQIEDVVDNCSAVDYQVYRIVHTLIQKGIVEVISASPGAEKLPPYAWAMPGALDRLREKLAPRGLPASGKVYGRVLLFCPDSSLKSAFLKALRGLPGFVLGENAGDSAAGPFPVVGDWALADGVSLRLLDTPVDELQRPLWALLSRGAVGGLFLLDGVRAAWVDALKPASDYFQSVRPVPIGYLILGGEPVQMEVKAKLVSTFTLKGDNALFMLPGNEPDKLRGILKRFLEQMINH